MAYQNKQGLYFDICSPFIPILTTVSVCQTDLSKAQHHFHVEYDDAFTRSQIGELAGTAQVIKEHLSFTSKSSFLKTLFLSS